MNVYKKLITVGLCAGLLGASVQTECGWKSSLVKWGLICAGVGTSYLAFSSSKNVDSDKTWETTVRMSLRRLLKDENATAPTHRVCGDKSEIEELTKSIKEIFDGKKNVSTAKIKKTHPAYKITEDALTSGKFWIQRNGQAKWETPKLKKLKARSDANQAKKKNRRWLGAGLLAGLPVAGYFVGKCDF